MADLREQFIQGVVALLKAHPQMEVHTAIVEWAKGQGLRRAFYATLSHEEQINLAAEIIERRKNGA